MRHWMSGAALALAVTAAQGAETELYIISPNDGAQVTSPVVVVFGLRGKGVAPAGVEQEGTGHHHILLNRAAYGAAAGDSDIAQYGIPADDSHIHFGGGQTETTLDLAPGTHTLQLLLGDHAHVPHDSPVFSDRITIKVTQ